jgi:hypothetical protein
LSLLYFASFTSPTISMSSLPLVPISIRLPTASRPRLNFFANASLTIATLGAPRRSARVNSRPASSGLCMVLK